MSEEMWVVAYRRYGSGERGILEQYPPQPYRETLVLARELNAEWGPEVFHWPERVVEDEGREEV